MKVTAEFEVNQELEELFLRRLENTAAGMGKEDRAEVEKMIAEIKSKPAENGAATPKKSW